MIPRCFMLKNGSTAVLRTAVPEDAAQMIAYLRACAEETDFLLRLPEEWDISVETEEALLRDMARQTENRMLVCSVKGEIAGTCQVACMNRLKPGTAPRCPSRCAGRIGVRAFPASCSRKWKPSRADGA